MYKLFIWDLGAWPLYSNWPLFGGGCEQRFHCSSLHIIYLSPLAVSLFNATCSSPPPVDHASLTTPISSGSYRINDIVSYECGQGYLVTGESSRRCLGGDRWSGEGPRCERGGEKKGHEE